MLNWFINFIMELNSLTLSDLERRSHIHQNHLKNISNYSKEKDLVIIIRDLNPSIPAKIKEAEGRYVGKDLHMKAKSSMLPELAGYIPVENRFAKKLDNTADEKIKDILQNPRSSYQAIPVVKVVNKDNSETKFTLCYDISKKENVFYYKNNEINKYYSTLDSQNEIHNINPSDLKAVEVLGDKKGNIIIPDYDLAILGNDTENFQTHTELDDDLGRIPTKSRKSLEDLKLSSDNMILHGSDNYNPISYKLEMSPESPYTCFLPDGTIKIANNPEEYLNIINQWRRKDKNPNQKSYDLILNPKLGVEVSKNGNIYFPENRFDWESLDNDLSKLKSAITDTDNVKKEFRLHNKDVTEKQFSQEKYELNKVIIEQYERFQRMKMQEIYYRDTENYDTYQEALQNIENGITHMKEKYKEIFNEEPLISKYQIEKIKTSFMLNKISVLESQRNKG